MCRVWSRNGWSMDTGAGAVEAGIIWQRSWQKNAAGSCMKWPNVWRNRYLKKKSRRVIRRDPDVSEGAKERRKRISISGNRACGWTGWKDTGGEKAPAVHGWILGTRKRPVWTKRWIGKKVANDYLTVTRLLSGLLSGVTWKSKFQCEGKFYLPFKKCRFY